MQKPAQLKSDIFYQMLVAVNGTLVTVMVNNTTAFSWTFPSRIIDGVAYGLNKGLVGMGSDNSRGVFDNVAVQILPPQLLTNARLHTEIPNSRSKDQRQVPAGRGIHEAKLGSFDQISKVPDEL